MASITVRVNLHIPDPRYVAEQQRMIEDLDDGLDRMQTEEQSKLVNSQLGICFSQKVLMNCEELCLMRERKLFSIV